MGYLSVLSGLFGFMLGLLWLVQKFLTPHSPSTFDLRTCIMLLAAGIILCLSGVALVWPKEVKSK